MDGEEEDEEDEAEGPGPEQVAAVVAHRDGVELLAGEAVDGQEVEKGDAGEDEEHGPVAPHLHEDRPRQDADGRAEVHPEGVEAVFPVLVHLGLVLVEEALERDVEGVVGRAGEEEEGGREGKAPREGERREAEGLDEEPGPDDAGHGDAVVDPPDREGHEERGDGPDRDERADLPARESDLEEMERGEEEDGRDGELPGEVEDVDLGVHKGPIIAFFGPGFVDKGGNSGIR